ncbi:uncharacterized protein LOC123293929 [Chrysoperla carnea]|uniref:uncharacterized protein LOC123293929 n=1 Tax=Chrysoperla carnea TaxID=189513 RepID=UPI001D076034|nr:uncharacterized protein LOC123293929 [Chrysoperla carnea]
MDEAINKILKLKKQYNKNKQQRYHPIKYEYHSAEQYKSVPHFNKYPTSSNCFVTSEPQNMQSIMSPSSQKYDNGHLLENRNVEHHMIKQSNPVLNDNKPNKEVSNTKIHELNTRLKQTTQQVIDQCKLIKELKKNLEEQNGVIDNLKFRLSRSESVCHNKQLLLEAYKSKLTNAISTNELNQSLKSQASRQCNIITNEMRVLEDNLKAMREREGELMKLVNQLGKDKNRLIEEINKKNSFTMEELQKQIEKALSERQEEIARQIRMNTKLNDLNNSANERLKKYEIGIEEFLWMVEDHLYQKYGDHDPVRKAHEMACSILHLTPTELREMFQDCHEDYNTKAPRMLDSWLTEYRKVTSNCDDDFPQKLAHFLYNICFSNKNNNNQSPNTSSKRN